MKTPVAVHVVYPSGTKADDDDEDDDSDEPERKTFAERQEDKKKGQERDLNRLRNLLENAKVYGKGTGKPDMTMEALAPAAQGTLPVVVRADDEDDIRGAVAFAEERGLKLILAGALEAWRCADLLKQKNVPVLLNVLRLPRRDSDPYDAAYANAALLQKAGVRFAIVSDDDASSPGTFPIRRRWREPTVFRPRTPSGPSRSRRPRSSAWPIGWDPSQRERTRTCSSPPETSWTLGRR